MVATVPAMAQSAAMHAHSAVHCTRRMYTCVVVMANTHHCVRVSPAGAWELVPPCWLDWLESSVKAVAPIILACIFRAQHGY